mgnify:CR=1 FL=1
MAGPFSVTQPNTALTWVGTTTHDVTWNVAGTAAAPVNTANVKISLSTDGRLDLSDDSGGEHAERRIRAGDDP